ncbi:MAG: shikimate kinase [Thermodesulfobacteriota bacterium]
MASKKTNIVLIGMAGAGKSTVGLSLARCLGRPFVDTDDLISSSRGSTLQETIDREGVETFRRYEEQVLLEVSLRDHVIATGGSVIYSERGMAHLRSCGTVVYLDLPLEVLQARVDNVDGRGLVRSPEQSFAELFEERQPLYGQWADLTIDCSGKSVDEISHEITTALGEKIPMAACTPEPSPTRR